MRFGGHETFPIREGWLHKGLKLLIQDPEKLVDEYAADWLGVGRNMAKAIRFWLSATELAEPNPLGGKGKKAALQETGLGRVIFEHDPYFLEPGTWWALHLNLVSSSRHALVWSWFFNRFEMRRFDRAVCVERFSHHLRLTERRFPSTRTLQRDVACLLASYAQPIPRKQEDPEDSHLCPFTELGLLSHFRTSGHYQLHSLRKEIPAHILIYSLARAFPAVAEGEGMGEISLHEAARTAGGPGKAFVLTNEALFETAAAAEANLPAGAFEIRGHAGERMLRVRRRAPIDWLREHYRAREAEGRNAA